MEELQKAIDEGELNRVKEILSKHGSKLCSEYSQWDESRRETPLHRAINQGQTLIAHFLLKYRKSQATAMIKAKDFRGETVLHRCSWCGRIEEAKKIIKLGGNVNATNHLGLTPLHLATEQGKAEIVELLLRHKANVNAKSNQGNTPLHRAITSEQHSTISLLIRAKADPDISNHRGTRAGGAFSSAELQARVFPPLSAPLSEKGLPKRFEHSSSQPRFSVEQAKVPGIDPTYYEIPPDRVTFGTKLGEGGFGTVFAGTVDGQPVALKQLTGSRVRVHENFRKELDVMCGLRHPNVVLLLGAVVHPEELCLVMELCQGGSLTTILQQRKFSLPQTLFISKQIALAMRWLHSRSPPMLHLDLKPANILLADLQSLTVKVSDFGLARSALSDSKAIVGTRRFMAPEMMKKQSVTEKADVYSFGVLLWQIYTRKKPFHNWKKIKTPQEKEEFAQVVLKGYRPTISLTTPPLLASLIRRCWATDPSHRPTFNEVIRWMDQILLAERFSEKSAQVFWDLASCDAADISAVRWKKFKTAFTTLLGDYDFWIESVKKLDSLVTESSPQTKLVRMERFSLLVNSFAPFHPPEEFLKRVLSFRRFAWPSFVESEVVGFSGTNGVHSHENGVLNKSGDSVMESSDSCLTGESCVYHPFIERDRAIAVLFGCPSGTFLLRNGKENHLRMPFFLSYVPERKRISHLPVYFDLSLRQYTIAGVSSTLSLEEFISKEICTVLSLKYAVCPSTNA